MRRWARTLALVVGVALPQAGCAHYEIMPDSADPDEFRHHETTMHGLFWGLMMKPEIFAAECGTDGIDQVTFTRYAYHDLAAVLTLWIWMPLRAEFSCRNPGAVVPK